MLVTVLMPVYNGARFLREAIDSVLAQTYDNFELLVIDDGSTDATSTILSSLEDPRVRVVRNEANLRLIRTLNKGIALARGEIIFRMDADDVCFPQRIERQVDFLRKRPEVAACGAYAIRVDENGKHGAMMARSGGAAANRSAWYPTPIIHPTAAIRTSVARQYLYREDALHCEDYELWLRMVQAGLRIDNYSRPLLYYRVHSAGISQANRNLQLANSFQVFRQYYPSLDVTFDEYRALVGAGSSLCWRRRIDLVRRLGASPAEMANQVWQHLRWHRAG